MADIPAPAIGATAGGGYLVWYQVDPVRFRFLQRT